ncbi:hypothetical protein Poli38472_008678 [Pythium oligandrum]|uniref:Uncharacterized protein n=1 Tax=Pythium oligandrum TaxID=41045 RepID=A0A8K1C431_PYTOL|nr:hypothetical protein Poli38472_008678 [Pythium oligandrum]|eukprot:TMW56030.1 hypothetical protein Poli38472_008678 [Pythium oligandrum]
MNGGSFRDLRISPTAARNGNGHGNGHSNGFRTGGGSPINNYSTFQSDAGVQGLMRTSDRIEQSKKTLAESEDMAKHVLVDLELQRSQLHDMKGMVTETRVMTGEAKTLLQRIADRSFRRKVCLWMIIVVLAITDIVVFYSLFIRR